MLHHEIIALLNEIEDRFSVAAWTADGVSVWPHVRLKLRGMLLHRYSTTFANSAQAAEQVLRKGVLAMPMRRTKALASGFGRYARAVVLDRAHNAAAPDGRPHVAFLSDGVSFVRRGGQWYEKFCDPLRDELEAQGQATFMFTQYNVYHAPRSRTSRFIQPFSDLQLALGVLYGGRSVAGVMAGWRDWAAFIDWLDQRHAGVGTYIARSLPFDLWHIGRMRRYFARHLRALKAPAGFMVNYYNREGIAFVLACRDLGIPSVDLQHGVQGSGHGAYGSWCNVPAAGWDMLPDYFWCWDQASADAITAWAGTAGAHRPVVGGNPLLHSYLAGSDFAASGTAALSERQARPDKCHVLYTLSGLEDRALLDGVIRLVRQSADRCHWWLRLHPTAIDRKAEVRALVGAELADVVTLDAASDLPLFAVLAAVDIHVTEVSSTVLEAAQFGIPSCVIHVDALQFFAAQISAGAALHTPAEEDVLAGIRAFSARPAGSRPTPDGLHEALTGGLAQVLDGRRPPTGLANQQAVQEAS